MAKLLLVEHDSAVRELLTAQLSREGFQVIAASNGMQTIALARTERPALILLASGLPLLDGWQVAQRLRAIPETQAIPIIVLTGGPPGEVLQQRVVGLCDAFEPKPVDFPQLLARIRWLARPDMDASRAVAPAIIGAVVPERAGEGQG